MIITMAVSIFPLSFYLVGLVSSSKSSNVQRPIVYRLRSQQLLWSNDPSAAAEDLNNQTAPIRAINDLLRIAKARPLLNNTVALPTIGDKPQRVVSPDANDEEMQALQRHRLHLYHIIEPKDFNGRDPEDIIEELSNNTAVEYARLQPIFASASQTSNGRYPGPQLGQPAAIPDYTECKSYEHYCQGYLLSPSGDLLPPSQFGEYKLGGVNALEAHRLAKNAGENVRVLQIELGAYDRDHIDLPKPWLVVQDSYPSNHATKSAGTIWGLDDGTGVKGIVAKAKAGYTKYSTENILELRHHLEAGDVVHIGVHSLEPGPWCERQNVDVERCWVPVEFDDAVHDAITYLTQEKGIHVIIAGNYIHCIRLSTSITTPASLGQEIKNAIDRTPPPVFSRGRSCCFL